MRRLLPAAAALLVAALAAAEVPVPALKARVTDLTGTLSVQQRDALEHTLAEFEARKGAQIALLLLPTTQPETVEQYAVRVEESWKLGRKGVDDGVLVVVAKDDRRVKIEVGYGLEGALPDAAAKRIIDEEIVPRFRQGDFYGGLRAGADRIMRVIEGEPLPAPREAPGGGRPGTVIDPPLLFGVLLVVLAVHGILRALFGRLIGSGVIGAAVGGFLWLISGWLFIALMGGIVAFMFSMWGRAGGGRGWSSGGGWSTGSWSSGGGSGGGFSGGGGSSGGGGASGSW